MGCGERARKRCLATDTHAVPPSHLTSAMRTPCPQTLATLVPHPGLQNPLLDTLDVDTDLLGDLWVFDLQFRR